MTNWRERRLGKWSRPWERGRSRKAQPSPQASGSAPLILTIAIRNSARNHAEEAVEALAGLMGNASSEHVRVAAANALLDRAVGRPLTGAQAAAEDGLSEDDDELEVRWLDPDQA
jgi:hypothetical protein